MRALKMAFMGIVVLAIVVAIIGAVSVAETNTYLDSVDTFIQEVEN